MNKRLLILALALILIIGFSVLIYMNNRQKNTENSSENSGLTENDTQQSFDAKNAVYDVGGITASLQNGIAENPSAPGSATKIVTTYFGNEARGDLNNDGREDIAFLLTQDTGGSGLFYYAVAALKIDVGYKITNAFLIGDRIAPQSTNIISGELHVNYAERNPGESMSTPPSAGAVKLLKVTPNGILEGLMK